MRFIHMADVHFDSPFTVSCIKRKFGNGILEQRKAFADTIEYIKKMNSLFILYQGIYMNKKYIRKSTIEYINNLFKEYEYTNIYMTRKFIFNKFFLKYI